MVKVDSPGQVMTRATWREKLAIDYTGGTVEAPTTIYLDPGGLGTVLGPAVLVEPWTAEETIKAGRMARAQIRGDEHHRETCGRAPWRTWERDSCGTCALLGWGAHSEQHGTPAPNYAGWARVYVQAREPIPRAWLAAFIAEMNDVDNEPYREALRRDVATFGYRLTDEPAQWKLRTPTATSVHAWALDYLDGSDTAAVEYLRALLDDPDEYDPATLRAIRQAVDGR